MPLENHARHCAEWDEQVERYARESAELDEQLAVAAAAETERLWGGA